MAYNSDEKRSDRLKEQKRFNSMIHYTCDLILLGKKDDTTLCTRLIVDHTFYIIFKHEDIFLSV